MTGRIIVYKIKCKDCKRSSFYPVTDTEIPKHCPRCNSTNITQPQVETFIEQYYKMIPRIIIGYAQWIWFYLSPSYRKINEPIAIKRWLICQKCNKLTSIKRCSLCGCVMIIKVKGKYELDKNGVSLNGCRLKKW